MHQGLLPHILADPKKADMPEHRLMEGIINTRGLLSDFQTSAIEGIVHTIPAHHKKSHVLIDSTVRPVGELAEPNKTRTTLGHVRFQGSRFY